MSEEVTKLQQMVADRDGVIAQLKVKTKDFVKQLKEDHAQQMQAVEAKWKTQLEEKEGALQNALQSLKEATATPAPVPPVQVDEAESAKAAAAAAEVGATLKAAQESLAEMTQRFEVAHQQVQSQERELEAAQQQILQLQDREKELRTELEAEKNRAKTAPAAAAGGGPDGTSPKAPDDPLSEPTPAKEQQDDDTVAALRAELVSAEAELSAVRLLQSQSESAAEGQLSDLRARLRAAEAELDGAVQQLSALTAEHDTAKAATLKSQEEASALAAKVRRLEEEKDGLMATSSGTLDKLATQNSALTLQVKHLEADVKAAEEAEAALTKELEELTERAVQQGKEVGDLKAALERDGKVLALLQAEAPKKDAELAAQKSEITALKSSVKALEVKLEQARAEKSDAEARRTFAENAKDAVDKQRSEILQTKGELQSALMQKEARVQELLAQIEDSKQAAQFQLEEKLKDAGATSSELRTKIASLTEQLEEQRAAAARLQAEAAGRVAAETELKATVEEQAATIDRLELQCAQEAAQNSERKVKFRAFVDNLTGEKAALEKALGEAAGRAEAADTTVVQLRMELEASRSEGEEQRKRLAAEVERLEAALAGLSSSREGEVSAQVQQLLGELNTALAETARMQAVVKEKEAEAEMLSAKRMTARSELIKMAQALERAQDEGRELSTLLQFTLLPMITEQTGSLESMLRLLESSANALASKASFRMKARASGRDASSIAAMTAFNADTSNASGAGGGGMPRSTSSGSIASIGDGDDNADGEDSVQCIDLTPQPKKKGGGSLLPSSTPRSTGKSPRFGVAPILIPPTPQSSSGRSGAPRRPSLSVTSSSGGAALSAVNSNGSVLECAESVRTSLDRLRIGLGLAGAGVDKLHSMIQLDAAGSMLESCAGCCVIFPAVFAQQAGDGDEGASGGSGGVWDSLMALVGFPAQGGLQSGSPDARSGSRMSIRGRRNSGRGGYVTVSSDSTPL